MRMRQCIQRSVANSFFRQMHNAADRGAGCTGHENPGHPSGLGHPTLIERLESGDHYLEEEVERGDWETEPWNRSFAPQV